MTIERALEIVESCNIWDEMKDACRIWGEALKKQIPIKPVKVPDDDDAGEWVSVADRLPEESGYYLVVYTDKDIRIREYAKKLWWDDNRNINVTDMVTHWMPLPETTEMTVDEAIEILRKRREDMQDWTEALDIVLDTLEQWRPKKPSLSDDGFHRYHKCERVMGRLSSEDIVVYNNNFCDNYGQPICWEKIL